MKVETKEDNIRFINVCSNVIGSFWMNELIQMDNGNQFLKISGLLSISTFVYDVIMIFINIDVDKNIKTFIVIQIVSDFLIIILEVIAFYFFCKSTNLFKFFDKNNKNQNKENKNNKNQNNENQNNTNNENKNNSFIENKSNEKENEIITKLHNTNKNDENFILLSNNK